MAVIRKLKGENSNDQFGLNSGIMDIREVFMVQRKISVDKYFLLLLHHGTV